MADAYVTVERDGAIALVRFDRKKNLNAFDGDLGAVIANVDNNQILIPSDFDFDALPAVVKRPFLIG